MSGDRLAPRDPPHGVPCARISYHMYNMPAWGIYLSIYFFFFFKFRAMRHRDLRIGFIHTQLVGPLGLSVIKMMRRIRHGLGWV
jgi:hypothetical protein